MPPARKFTRASAEGDLAYHAQCGITVANQIQVQGNAICQILLRNGKDVTFEHATVDKIEKHPEFIEVVTTAEGEEQQRRSLFPLDVIQEVHLGPGQTLTYHEKVF